MNDKDTPARRAYAPPRLTRYGKFNALTASGSGVDRETGGAKGKAHLTKRP